MKEPAYLLEKLFSQGNASIFTVGDLFMAMFITTILCSILSLTYKKTHRGINYSQSILTSMFLMSIATSIVMLIIGTNIARAFSLVGALSIIRFRTAMKDPRDTAYLFVGIVAGMGAGTGFYTASIFLTLFVCVLMWLFDIFGVGQKGSQESVLKITLDNDQLQPEKAFEGTLKKYFKSHRLVNRVKNFESDDITNVYIVRPKRKKAVEEFESKLSDMQGIKGFSHYKGDQHAPV